MEMGTEVIIPLGRYSEFRLHSGWFFEILGDVEMLMANTESINN